MTRESAELGAAPLDSGSSGLVRELLKQSSVTSKYFGPGKKSILCYRNLCGHKVTWCDVTCLCDISFLINVTQVWLGFVICINSISKRRSLQPKMIVSWSASKVILDGLWGSQKSNHVLTYKTSYHVFIRFIKFNSCIRRIKLNLMFLGKLAGNFSILKSRGCEVLPCERLRSTKM